MKPIHINNTNDTDVPSEVIVDRIKTWNLGLEMTESSIMDQWKKKSKIVTLNKPKKPQVSDIIQLTLDSLDNKTL